MTSNEVDRDSISLADLLGLDSPDSTKAKRLKKRKITRFYSEEHVQQALNDIDNGILSLRKAAQKYNVPRSTLVFRRSPRFTKTEKGPRPVLSKEEEDQLAMWILAGEKYGAPRRYSHIQEWVQKLLTDHPRDNVPFPDNKPQRGWMKSFLRRHPELDAMKNMSFDDHCIIARANVKKVASEDVSTKPADIISQSIANELVDPKDVASLRRAIYRTRVAIKEKTPLEPSTSVSGIADPLTADPLLEEEFSQVLPKLEVVDPEYEQEPGHSRYSSADIASESQDSGKETEPITARDVDIQPEPGEEEQGFDEENTEPADKRIKVEYHDLYFPGEEGSRSFGRAGSSQSSASSKSRQLAANSFQLSDDVEYLTQTAMASPAKRGQDDPPGPNRAPTAQVVHRRDRNDIFGEYIAAKLRSLKTDAARNRVECLIANILFEATRGKFDDSESTTDITAELQSFISCTKDLQTLKSESNMDSCTYDEPAADELGS